MYVLHVLTDKVSELVSILHLCMYLVVEEGDHVRENDLLRSLWAEENAQLGSTVL